MLTLLDHSPSDDQLSVDRVALNDGLRLSLHQNLQDGDYGKILTSPVVRVLLGHDEGSTHESHSFANYNEDWIAFISGRLHTLLRHPDQHCVSEIRDHLLVVGVAALNAFLQVNVTGPLLTWDVAKTLLPHDYVVDPEKRSSLKRQLILNLTSDGEAVYQLTPHIELFCLAKCILNQEHEACQTLSWVWARQRCNFWHQRMLNDTVSSLQKIIYVDLGFVEKAIFDESSEVKVCFLLERASILTYYGFYLKAREDIEAAAKINRFEFALTGRLGKRTKYQQDELSQLVVLARSADDTASVSTKSDEDKLIGTNQYQNIGNESLALKPIDLDLNDDTLLEVISFSKKEPNPSNIQDKKTLTQSLTSLDPGNQPTLQPLDSIILLAVASSIINSSPTDDLTREETLPYATRVLSGRSSNWQIFTQALLVRSRIEAYRSRTVERGALQLQAIVDQIIADTSQSAPSGVSNEVNTVDKQLSTSFLPRSKESESAPVSERLLYIHQLASPTRWKLETELASRWVALGGLRTALEIYERLQMWAEVALCWAASDREDEARRIVRRQLYESSLCDESNALSNISSEQKHLPPDAPRLFCILGDLEKDPTAYTRAWEISGNRYARAQRSLGKHYLSDRNLGSAEEAYVKSLKINPQNHVAWFTLGSIRLQLKDWVGAADAFGRAIQIDEKDAESWSNLAVALLNRSSDTPLNVDRDIDSDVGGGNAGSRKDSKSVLHSQRDIKQAFVALKRAASIKRDSYRIWQNLLNVAARLSPPPYTDMIIAQTRLIEILGNVEGEKCIDTGIIEGLVAHLVALTPAKSPPLDDLQETIDPLTQDLEDTNALQDFESRRLGFPRMLIDLVQKKIAPLITTSRRLWLINAKISLYLIHPFAALAAYEKAWRISLNKPGWENGSNEAIAAWNDVVDATVELIDAYENLGERRREAGMGEGELVCKEWKFKSRSALRGVLGRAREGWDGSEGYETLKGRLDEFKAG